MKKLFLLLTLLGMVAIGCSKDEGGSENNIPENIFFGLDKESVTISPDGGSVDVIVYSNYKWEISGTSDWCTPSVKGGDANEDGQKVTFSADVAYDDREATFWFRCADEKIKFVVSQDGTISADEIWYTSADGNIVEPCSSKFHDDANILSVFGAKIKSNSYDAEKECWVIKFDGDVTTIGYYAFYGCSGLTSVTIGDSVTEIGYAAFSACSSLTSVTIPDSVTTIGGWAFGKCSNLTNVTIPDSVTTIGEYAFAYCDSLTSITIPGSVTTIGEGAFCECSSLTSITIPDSVTTIGRSAFYNCSSLTSVTIPDSVTEIGRSAFAYCSSLTSVTIGDSVTTIGDYAFEDCSSLTSVTIPDSVTTIGEAAFDGCESLTEFRGKYASEDGRCLIIDGTLNSFAPAGLTEYNIPDSVTTIGVDAFSDYSSLTSITIPDSVTTIGNCAFEDCSSLTSVYCKATTPPAGGLSMFSYNASGRKIYVPTESVNAYKSASGWSDYASAIVGYEF